MMPQLVLDAEACRKCGTCVRVCPASSFSLGARGLSFNGSSCIACGQCVACCPQGALSWDGCAPRRVDRAAYPRPEQVESLLAGRLSIWDFGSAALDPAVLDRLVRAVHERPAETAGLEMAVVTDPETRRSLDIICLDRFERLYVRRYSRPCVFGFWKRIGPSVEDLDRALTRQALKKGSAFRGAPALIFILGDPRRRRAAAGAQAALAGMAVLAEAAGLGTCLQETAGPILNSSRRARKILSLARGKSILGILLVGFPETKPGRAAGLPIPRRWIKE